jgi:hypothetical protein
MFTTHHLSIQVSKPSGTASPAPVGMAGHPVPTAAGGRARKASYGVSGGGGRSTTRSAAGSGRRLFAALPRVGFGLARETDSFPATHGKS